MTTRLISPNRRRIADSRTLTVNAMLQLRGFGWTDYTGPCDTTGGHTRTTAGWIIPGTDEDVDKARFAITGTTKLGPREPVTP